MNDQHGDKSRPAPQEWIEALEQSRADVAAGCTVPMEKVLADLYASLGRLEARSTETTPDAA